MDTKSGSGKADDAKLTREQQRLVQSKLKVLGQARELQAELAGVRSELRRLDKELFNAGFLADNLACW